LQWTTLQTAVVANVPTLCHSIADQYIILFVFYLLIAFCMRTAHEAARCADSSIMVQKLTRSC